MSMNSILHNLEHHGIDVTGLEDIVNQDAFVAAAATGAAAFLPGTAVPAAVLASTTAVWHMYIKLAGRLGITWSKGVFRTLASAAVSNVAINIGGMLAVDALMSIIPGGSVLVGSAVTFCAVYIAGMMFLAMLGKLMNRYGKLPLGELDEETLKECIVCDRRFIKDALKEAKAAKDSGNA